MNTILNPYLFVMVMLQVLKQSVSSSSHRDLEQKLLMRCTFIKHAELLRVLVFVGLQRFELGNCYIAWLIT
ncbi:hypothetical protein M758_8G144800 [Ceratodon purpureus]|uniref:Uncharacterized protein n=1 Tax=Ceratodon purpureus TaxID=3225 RepID=A0A8T0H3H3_CERPU|nr:hypothetical protein KC19_8G148600 [Ceratodon purpureus]KAG0608935.1 hypothetical protein M758_8G144800 [Ceratodon purpureus]